MSDLQAKILSNGAGVVAAKPPPLPTRDKTVAASPPKRLPPSRPDSQSSVPHQFALADRFTGLRDAPQTPQHEAAPAEPESAAPALTPVDDPDQPALNTSQLHSGTPAAEAGPPKGIVPPVPDLPASEPLQPEIAESAAPVQVATRPPGPMTDQEVVNKLLLLGGQPAGQRDREALKELSGLLASHNFDFGSMSATNVGRLHIVLHRDGLARQLDEEKVNVFSQHLERTFNENFPGAIDDASIDSLALKINEAQTPQAREVLAYVVARMPQLGVAKLFVALQRTPGEFEKHADPVILRITGTFKYLDLQTLNYLKVQFSSLTPLAKTMLGEQVASARPRIQLRLMKETLAPILSGVQERDPGAISSGVEAAKRIQADFLDLLPASVPTLSNADQRVSLQNLITAALPAQNVTPSQSVLRGKIVTLKAKGKIVTESERNDVSRAANRTFHGFTKAKAEASREETANVKLFRDAVDAAALKL